MTLPIDRTALIAAATNQVPNSLIRSALNMAALTVPYNTIDELNNKVNNNQAGQTAKLAEQAVLINALQTGDSGAAANAARLSTPYGITYATLKDRVDATDTRTIALQSEKANQTDLSTTNANVSANATAIVSKAEKAYVDTQLASVASGSPKAVYATLSALQTAFPTGDTNIYLVTADGNWYYWNGSAWTAGGIYQGLNVPDKSVNRAQMNTTPSARLVFNVNTYLNFNTATSTIDVPACTVQTETANIPITATSLPISSFTVLTSLCIDLDTNALFVALYTEYATKLANKNIAVLFSWDGIYTGCIPHDFKIDGKLNVKHRYDKLVLGVGAYVDFDTINNQLIFPGGWVQTETNFVTVAAATLSSVPSTALNSLIFNRTTSALSVIPYTDYSTLNDDNINILWSFNGALGSDIRTVPFAYSLNGVKPVQPTSLRPSTRLILGAGVYANFDTVNRQIVFPTATWIQTESKFEDPVNKTVAIVGDETTALTSLCLNVSTKTLFTATYTQYPTLLVNKDVAIIWTWSGGFGTNFSGVPFPYGVDGSAEVSASGAVFAEVACRLVLPPKMFFVAGEELPIYKNSLIGDDRLVDTFKAVVIDIKNNAMPRVRSINEEILIDGADIEATTFRIGAKPKGVPSYNYYADIAKSVVSANANTGESINWLPIGDSLQEYGAAAGLKTRLADFGVTANVVGTYSTISGEGKWGWAYKNFIGLDNTHINGPTVIALAPSGATTTTVFQNPFLKLADATDKANHPTWCFRNTGSNIELSYASDADKTGNFYIFDFAYYLSNHTVTTPDIITIALSTNDVWQDTDGTYLANCRLAMEIMLKQIKTALPSVKIGIVPIPAWGSTTVGISNCTKAMTWAENCMTDISTFALTSVEVVPIWCHVNKDWSFPYASEAAVNDVSSTFKGTRDEFVHYTDDFYMEYANAFAAYVMNVI